MSTTKRPNQVLFYANEKVQGILTDHHDAGLEETKSEFINRAIVAFAERRAGGEMYKLQQAYDALRFMSTPEAEAVRKALQEILWRRSDTPNAVKACIHFNDGTPTFVDHFIDDEKAIMFLLSRPNAIKLEAYDKNNQLVCFGSRSNNNTFVLGV